MEQQQHDPRASEEGWCYANFVRHSPTAARTVETLLRYSGFFAPARFADRDLSIESGYALSSLAALAHDQILLHGQGGGLVRGGQDGGAGNDDGLDGGQVHALGITPGSSIRLDPKSRGKRSSTAVVAQRMRVALAMIANVQIVVEKLAAQHGGPRRRRQAIVYLETLKALARLLLLACTREMVMGGGSYVSGGNRSTPPRGNRNKAGAWREVDLNGGRLDQAQSSKFAVDRPSSPPCPHPEVYTGKRSGVKLIVPPRASVVWSGRGRSNRSGGVNRVAATASSPSCGSSRRSADGAFQNDISSSSSFRGCANGGQGSGTGGSMEAASDEPCLWRQRRDAQGGQAWLMAGEVIHILRPLAYSYGCAATGERSWRPWLISLGMDAAAFAFTAKAGGSSGAMALLTPIGETGSSGVPVLPYLNEEQAAELRRRKMLWFLYLMRSPAFELLAEPVSRGASGVFEGVPILGSMAGYALNMLLYVQRHHFYTSAS
ncbi:unnamed protein product [Ectocarpus sp. CCAP 1310/34]|nr:unnamed protein product [Ectocarpus sp. CCAP 1310/34]